jgi:hypothetical protein
MMDFDIWLEDVENTVYVYFSDDLDSLISEYNLDIDYLYENDYSSMDIVRKIQSIIEGDDFYDD